MTPEQIEGLAAQLKLISDELSNNITQTLPAIRGRHVREAITEAYEKLRHIAENLDPIKQPDFIFDPSDPNVVGRLVGIAMIAQPRKPLKEVGKFYGSGVYAIYYNGDFQAYAAIKRHEHPIYVGKADPENPAGKTAIEQGDRLAKRLNDHRKNISKAASTLNLEEFEYRALVVQSGWQVAAESFLIHLFKPIWNSEINICYGFGKHGDDPGTRANQRSPWDTLHPGRDWAYRDANMKDAKEKTQIISEIATHFQKNQPFTTVDVILRQFLNQMSSLL